MITELKIGHCYSFSRRDGLKVVLLGVDLNYYKPIISDYKKNFILLGFVPDKYNNTYKIIYNNQILLLSCAKNFANCVIEEL